MLSVKNLSMNYWNGGIAKEAIRDISFHVEEGEFLCILGPSGCGKTSLLRCIGGFEPYSSGSIRLDGKSVSRPGLDRLMVFQGFEQLFAWKTVRKNVEYPLKMNGVPSNKRKMIARHFLELVGLLNEQDHYPHQLSGGMKQRTAIARALALQPRVLLMDEPFGNLDALSRFNLQNELVRIWTELHNTVIFVTHDIQEAILLADHILVLSDSPGELKAMVANPLQRPRKTSMVGFNELWDLLYDYLGNERSKL